MIFCTSICANYLPKARALAISIRQYMPDSKIILCIIEPEIPVELSTIGMFDDIVLAKDIGFDNFESFVFRHTIVEASTAVKGNLFLYLMEKYITENKFIYLDPDTYVYSQFIELDELLNHHSIIIAPHLLSPGNIDMEISSLAHGCYNLGFLAVSRSENAQKFIQWWADRLFLYCYDDKKRGLFTDQRWIDLAPCFFDVHILRHHGYDFATWSLLNAKIDKHGDNYTINGEPLRFIHFSGSDGGTVHYAMAQWASEECKKIFGELYSVYLSKINSQNLDHASSLVWGYTCYESGERISKKARIAYRDLRIWKYFPYPFSSSNTALRITAWCIDYVVIYEKIIKNIHDIGILRTIKKVWKKI